jgi:hypothetical protein
MRVVLERRAPSLATDGSSTDVAITTLAGHPEGRFSTMFAGPLRRSACSRHPAETASRVSA